MAPHRIRSRRRRALPLVLGLVGTASGLAGCGSSSSAAPIHTTAKAIDVVASAYPLAQLAAYIGGSSVRVTDLAPAGAQPRGLVVSGEDRGEIERAAVVIDVGDGYQPQVEAAAAANHDHLAVLPAVSKQVLPYQFWLDPALMARAAPAVARALSRADPARRSAFSNGARDFQAVAISVGSDYVNSLSTCTSHQFMTTDDAFGRLAAANSLQDFSVQSLGTKKSEAVVNQDHLPSVFTEVGVSSGPVQLVAGSTGASVKTLNPLEVAPYPGTKPLTYFAVMEGDLQALEGPLACDTTETFS